VSPITGDPVAGVAIESNGEDEWVVCVPADAEALSAEEILARIKEAGIVGLGGAAFPTHVKLSRPPESPAHTLLVNGAECEPYITADAQLMLEQTDRILQGIKILARLLSVSRVYIAIEDNKPEAIAGLTARRVRARSARRGHCFRGGGEVPNGGGEDVGEGDLGRRGSRGRVSHRHRCRGAERGNPGCGDRCGSGGKTTGGARGDGDRLGEPAEERACAIRNLRIPPHRAVWWCGSGRRMK